VGKLYFDIAKVIIAYSISTKTRLLMPRKPNGTIMILAPDHTGAGRKAIDLKVTQRFPIFDLGLNSGLIRTDGSIEDKSEYRHLSVPPDLRVHLTKASTNTGNDREFLIRNPLTSAEGNLIPDHLHVMSFISAPVINYPEPKDSSQRNHTWHQAVIIGLPRTPFSAPFIQVNPH